MNYWKDKQIQIDERGFGYIDTNVCSSCVGNKFLKQFVEENGNLDICTYCEEDGVCIKTEKLFKKIMDRVRLEYARAVDELGYIDGEYQGETTPISSILEGLYEDLDLNENLFKELIDLMGDEEWCEEDSYRTSDYKDRKYSWDDFCKMVKHEARYVFFRMPKERGYKISPIDILDCIASEIEDLNLIIKIPAKTRFYRGRTHSKDKQLKTAKDLASPPIENAKNNRMSAEGISIFYGADNKQTVLAEISVPLNNMVTVAQFENNKDLYCLDLTKINQIKYPSLFDIEQRHIRKVLPFYYELNKNLTRPFEKMQSIEYIPVQIIAEYFRYLYKDKGIEINGIKYNSAKKTEGICYALFFNHEQCLNNEDKEFWQEECVLHFLEDTVETIIMSPKPNF